MTFSEARRRAAREVGVLDARHLLAWAAGVAPADIVALGPDPLPEGATVRLERALARRREGWSVAHVTGRAEFWGRDFAVTRAVLAPRPETETLVERALSAPFADLLDLGTGSGCIAVTLLAERRDAAGLASDLSGSALACARKNAARHGVESRLRMRRSDWWDKVHERFDLVVSNPPYIGVREMDALSPEVLREPRKALTDGGDGLGAYREICGGLAAHLRPGGRAIVEIGPTQGTAVRALFAAAGLEDVRVHPDMDGRDRVVEGHLPA